VQHLRLFKTSLFSLVLALIFAAGAVPPANALDQTSAPTATFDFTGFTPQTPSFVVHFSDEVDPVSATDLNNYFYGTVDSVQDRSLVGAAQSEYDASRQQVTIRITDSTTIADREGSQYAVQNVRGSGAAIVIARTAAGPVQSVNPSAPGVPVLSSAQNDRQLQWVWSASVDQGPAPSGVASYSYELIKDGILIANGYTADSTVTLPVSEDGQYLFRVWAHDRVGLTSEIVTSTPTNIDATGPTVVITQSAYEGNTATPTVSVTDEPLTFVWTTTASSRSVKISDPTLLRPLITFLQDGAYQFTLTATDAFGNSTQSTITMTYAAPFIPGSGEPLAPIEAKPIEFVDKVASAAPRVTQQATNLGDASTSYIPTEPTVRAAATPAVPSTAGADDILTTTAAVAPTAQGWKILGMLWYWWILIIAIVVTAWLWGRSVGRSEHPDDA
jgi:hypothetical protein